MRSPTKPPVVRGKPRPNSSAPCATPTGNLALGHAVIEWIWISIERPSQGQTVPTWRAVTDWRGSQKPHEFQGPVFAFGPSGIIAAMRALVMATFGERVPKS